MNIIINTVIAMLVMVVAWLIVVVAPKVQAPENNKKTNKWLIAGIVIFNVSFILFCEWLQS